MFIFLIILIICIFIGGFLAVIIFPFILMSDKSKLRKIDEKISEFEQKSFGSPEEKEKAKYLLKKELIKIKSEITEANRETASDKINLL